MTLDEYQNLAMRTMAPDTSHEKHLAVMGLGLTGEAGEVAELLKKHLGHGHELDNDKLEKELGDVMWYVAGLARVRGLTLERIAEKNVLKLMKRYPEGFSDVASKNRVE